MIEEGLRERAKRVRGTYEGRREVLLHVVDCKRGGIAMLVVDHRFGYPLLSTLSCVVDHQRITIAR